MPRGTHEKNHATWCLGPVETNGPEQLPQFGPGGLGAFQQLSWDVSGSGSRLEI